MPGRDFLARKTRTILEPDDRTGGNVFKRYCDIIVNMQP
jgi:hypothetical protein